MARKGKPRSGEEKERRKKKTIHTPEVERYTGPREEARHCAGPILTHICEMMPPYDRETVAHTYIHTCIYTHARTHARTHIHTCMHTIPADTHAQPYNSVGNRAQHGIQPAVQPGNQATRPDQFVPPSPSSKIFHINHAS